jgi:hypothetical protein
VPEPVFEQYVEEVREQGRHDGKTELTTAGALVVARQYRSRRTPTEAATPLQEQLGTRDGSTSPTRPRCPGRTAASTSS